MVNCSVFLSRLRDLKCTMSLLYMETRPLQVFRRVARVGERCDGRFNLNLKFKLIWTILTLTSFDFVLFIYLLHV